ncbi:MAG TPA: metallophosphoesterase [Candidatus Limnocylindria bacterium]|nr:metallophosphoesterase [Candidatus Limnocylindria bacterium]
MPPKKLLPLARFAEFDEVLSAFFVICKTGALAQATNWVGQPPATNAFLNTATAYFLPSPTAPSSSAIPFEPFTQKLTVPDKSEIFFRADLHGDVHSLIANLTWLNEQGYLRGFGIARTNFHMIFLGDYTDRGSYGVEVLYTLLRMKLANPDKVFLLRGNHEEVSLQLRYGFVAEGRAKYGASFDAAKVERAYDFFPVVIYTGSGDNFIQCNHGGMEPGFAPGALLDSATASFQFLGILEQKKFSAAHPEWLADADNESRRTAAKFLRDFHPTDPLSPVTLGFMWNDFTVVADEPQLAFNPERSFIYGARATQFLLRNTGTKTKQVQAVFRGHQHSSAPNPMMRRLVASRGVFRHWQDSDSPALLNVSVKKLATVLEQDGVRSIPPHSVWTFNVSPDSVYGEACGFDFDAFGILKIAGQISDWRLQVVNVPVKP